MVVIRELYQQSQAVEISDFVCFVVKGPKELLKHSQLKINFVLQLVDVLAFDLTR